MPNSPFTAIFDACVLYPAPLRDLLIWLALSGRFRARWSADIQDEWVRNLLKNRSDLQAADLARTASLMNQAIPEALVVGYEPLIDGLQLPDRNDRHVLAAAIRCHASVIVTFNERDFPAATLSLFGIEAQHPDVFISNLLGLDVAAVVHAARKQRTALVKPPLDVDRYLAILLKQGLVQTVKALEAYRVLL